MNPTHHSELSVKRYGGKIENYFEVHSFCDASKEINSTNRHRIFTHNMWFLRRVIVPIFGATITNSDNKKVDVKDMMEVDHFMADFKNKNIPTLSDYVSLVQEKEDDAARLEQFQTEHKNLFDNDEINDLMVSPFAQTGKLVSLFITHNSWFVCEILTKLFGNINLEWVNFSISPNELTSRMLYANWLHGDGFAPSASNLPVNKKTFVPFEDQIVDGGSQRYRDSLKFPPHPIVPILPEQPYVPEEAPFIIKDQLRD